VAALNDLINRVRLELGDMPAQFTTVLLADGGKDYYVKVKPLEPAYLVTTITSGAVSTATATTTAVAIGVSGTTATYAQGTDFTVEEDLGIIHFLNKIPAAGASITVSGTHYRYFSNKDIITFINTAIAQHTYNRTDSYGRQMNLALIPTVEEYPLALLAVTEALWALATDAAFDINITAPDGVVIPRSQRFSQLTSMIANRKAQYEELCKVLNIGLWRTEMGTLRRVSRTTNKLVPVYVPQEIDDARKPERVYLQNDLLGRTPTPSTAQVYDIILTQGDNWSADFDFPNTLTLADYTIKAQIRTYPESPTLIASFNVAITSTAESKITLSLTPDQTKSLPLKAFWDLQFTKTSGGVVIFEQTYVKGLVLADRQVTDDAGVAPYPTNIHGSVRTVSTYNLAALSGFYTIDGVTLTSGDRVLVNGQTDATTNGIYTVAAGAWSRADDANSTAELSPGLTVFVDKGGTTWGNTGWVLNSSFPVYIGTTAIRFVNTIARGWSNN